MRSCCKIFPNTSNYKVAVLIYSFHCNGYKLRLLYKEAGHKLASGLVSLRASTNPLRSPEGHPGTPRTSSLITTWPWKRFWHFKAGGKSKWDF